jgi:hypothetical protein
MKPHLYFDKLIVVNLLILLFLMALSGHVFGQKSLNMSFSADYTTVRDEVSSSAFNYTGFIPAIKFGYSAVNERHAHDFDIKLAMGNPELPYGLRSLLMQPAIDYELLFNLPFTQNFAVYAGGGLSTQGLFLMSDLGKITYLWESSFTVNGRLRFPFPQGWITADIDVPILSAVSRSPYSVFSPELREALHTPWAIPFFDAGYHTPIDYFRTNISVGYNRRIGRSMQMGLEYEMQFLLYDEPQDLKFAVLSHSLWLSIGSIFGL